MTHLQNSLISPSRLEHRFRALGLALLLGAGLLVVSAPARAAISISVDVARNGVATGQTLTARPGDVIGLDVTLRSDGEQFFGIFLSASGYDEAVVDFDSGLAKADLFCEFGQLVGCFAGVINNTGTSAPPIGSLPRIALEEERNAAFGVRVPFAVGSILGGARETGALDPGVVTGVAGDPQARILFRAHDLGTTQIRVGAFVPGEGIIVATGAMGQVSGEIVSIQVIPEPTTGALVALGLMGLGWKRRRA